MAPKKNAANGNGSADETGSDITGSDAKLLGSIFKRCANTAKPNLAMTGWEAVAAEVALKDVKSARERYRQVCKKLGWFDGEDVGTPVKTPAAGISKRKATTINEAGNDEATEPETPSKSPKKRKAPTKKATPAPEPVPAPAPTPESEAMDDNIEAKDEDPADPIM